ncbi:P-loop containing nucleoside triphosphate hydrolase protein [Rhizodiscina lignyota]|uniref:Signal recognition particle receptor subunit beta n=1 Tax=Rhizodiscina lignyota TaxID=1504668 RepID=A0A9P4IFX8_9PEZI|nr:P-loop containing nucleoside triphosphate hydrolase protein [Rhizodiscina lignyota]
MNQRLEDLLTKAWGPSLPVIIVTAIVALLLPILVHTFLYRARTPTSLPSFLLVGPSGSGKTSLLTVFENGSPAPTHLSQTPSTVQVQLPPSTKADSQKYRSEHDPTAKQRPKFLIIDTPGHGKLRNHAFEQLRKPQPHLKGIIFVVDSASLSSDTPGRSAAGLTEAAQYLHDILLLLQKRYTGAKSSKGPPELPVLIAANKLDLFTALPAQLVKSALEAEITRIRTTRAKGLLDSAVKDETLEEEREWLGDGGEGKFEFGQMEEVNVPIKVVGGNVIGADGSDISGWWEWIGEQL